jgi:ubiquinone/menaquinone biosynthesis C-methylase UbiE
MSIFRWTAPLFQYVARQRSIDDFRALAGWLRPYVAPGGVFADLGGGTGEIGKGIARALDARVVIVDETPQMLARVAADPLVSVRLASAAALPFPTAYFDGLLCCDAWHHFRDQDAAAREMARVVRPGGGVLILDAEATGPNKGVAVVERMLGEPAGFRSMEDMQEFLGGRGIMGTCTPQRRGYVFVGSVRTGDR